MEEIFDDVTWGPIGKDIVPSPIYQVYRISGTWIGDDESLWYSFEPGDDLEPSEIAIVDKENPEITYDKIEANKYGITENNEIILVTITPSSQLAELYPAALVKVDGKTYDLALLDNNIEFFMNKNHRVSIEWTEDLVETFRIIKA